jgi:hypothetical protein
MSVLMEAKCVKIFFLRYLFDNKDENELRARLLAYIPEKCNYGFDPETLVTELVSWHQPYHELSFHLQLKFTDGCEMQVSREYYSDLEKLCTLQTKLLGFKRVRPPTRKPESISVLEKVLLALRLV